MASPQLPSILSVLVLACFLLLPSSFVAVPVSQSQPKSGSDPAGFSALRHPVVARYNSWAPTCPVLLPNDSPVYTTPRPSASPWLDDDDLDYDDPSWQSSSQSSSQSHSRPRARIVGGRRINPALSHYVAVLQDGSSTSSPFCTASIAAPRLLITAAHCVLNDYGGRRRNLRAIFGSDIGHGASGTVVAVKRAVAHPLFSMPDFNSTGYDIAYIELASDIPASARIMKLNDNDAIPAVHSVVRAAGYGLHYDMNDVAELPNTKLHQVDVPITPMGYCKRQWIHSYYEIGIDAENTICAGYNVGGCGICHGDSGGPIVQYGEDGIPVLVGVTAITYSCELEYVPSGYSRISYHVKDFLPKAKLTLTSDTAPIFLTSQQAYNPFSPALSSTPRPIPVSVSAPSTSASPSMSPSSSPTVSSTPAASSSSSSSPVVPSPSPSMSDSQPTPSMSGSQPAPSVSQSQPAPSVSQSQPAPPVSPSQLTPSTSGTPSPSKSAPPVSVSTTTSTPSALPSTTEQPAPNKPALQPDLADASSPPEEEEEEDDEEGSGLTGAATLASPGPIDDLDLDIAASAAGGAGPPVAVIATVASVAAVAVAVVAVFVVRRRSP